MNITKKNSNQRQADLIFFKKFLFLSLILVLFFPAINSVLYLYYSNRFPHQTYVANINISNLTLKQATDTINSKINSWDKTIFLLHKETEFTISAQDIELLFDTESTVNNIHLQVKNTLSSNIFSLQTLSSLTRPKYYPVAHTFNNQKLDQILSTLDATISEPSKYPTAGIINGSIVVKNGTNGIEINIDKLKEAINRKISVLDYSPEEIPLTTIHSELSKKEISDFEENSSKLLTKFVLLKHEDFVSRLDDKILLSFLNVPSGINDDEIDIFLSEIEKKINSEPQNSVFIFDEDIVKEFVPSQRGVKVEREDLKNRLVYCINDTIEGNTDCSEVEIPVVYTKPDITNSEVNNLGINERLGVGSSLYKGSITSRIHNIGLAAEKINGSLLAPGEEFSFNKTLGDVSSLTGYKQAYIIKDGKTVLGDGGGVCQVSTTLFRAVLNSGLPVSERASHSYRVYYYEQGSPAGLDATVFDPSPDLKFINDTPEHILIQTIFEPKSYSLKVEIYGTSDGRKASVGKPVSTASIPPPEDMYVDDPSLPIGTVKQIEYKAWGGKFVFDYIVERDNEIIFQKKFVSNYKPWQAVYLKGTSPI